MVRNGLNVVNHEKHKKHENWFGNLFVFFVPFVGRNVHKWKMSDLKCHNRQLKGEKRSPASFMVLHHFPSSVRAFRVFRG
jgi:hypothetical protein